MMNNNLISRLTLTLFEFRVLLVNHIHHTVTSHHDAIFGSFLYRCSDFHFYAFLIVNNLESFFLVLSYTITGDDLDVVHPHLPREMGQNLMAAFEADTVQTVTQGLDDFSVNFNCCLFCHIFVF